MGGDCLLWVAALLRKTIVQERTVFPKASLAGLAHPTRGQPSGEGGATKDQVLGKTLAALERVAEVEATGAWTPRNQSWRRMIHANAALSWTAC